MDFGIRLACSHMMMDCPRCGFSQPKDRYCANCGLDVEHFVVKPKPWLVRVAQNPNVHLSMLAVLIVFVLGFILYSQSERFGREVGNLLRGTPLSSREAGEPRMQVAAAKTHVVEAAQPDPEPAPEAVAAVAPPEGTDSAATPTGPAGPAAELQKVEVSYWEIPREALSTLISGAEKLGESAEGRAYFWSQGAKTFETVQTAARRISLSRTMAAQNGAQLSVETSGTELFQFGIYFQLAKAADAKEYSLKWESSMVLPPPEAPGAPAASVNPKALSEVSLTGSTTLTSTSTLMIVFEPSNRAPREDLIAKAGDGPWSVFNSEAFRAGVSDWIILVQGK